MSFVLTRMFAYFTLLSYLVVGTAAVRFLLPETTEIIISTDYLSVFTETSVEAVQLHPETQGPHMEFAEIKFPKEPVKVAVKKVVLPKVEMKPIVVEMKQLEVVRNELPFSEPVKLAAVQFDYPLPQNLVSLYQDFSFKEEMVAEVVEDAVSTKMASTDAEPEFFEYETKEASATQPAKEEKIVEAGPMAKEDVIKEVVQDIANDELVAFDYSQPEEQGTAAPQAEEKSTKPEEVSIGDLVGFDYSKASQDIAQNITPKVSVNTHKKKDNYVPVPPAPGPAPKPEPAPHKKSQSFESQLTIQLTGMNLTSTKNLNGFEVRFQDEQSAALSDYGTGEVQLQDELSQRQQTRSITLLKHGYAPTSTDVILEAGGAAVSIPVVDQETFNKEMEAYEPRGAVGAVLVELDDATEVAQLDVPFGKVITLNGDLKKTKQNDFRYQLFVGVQAGNAFLTYKRVDGQKVSKIIHVHEHEVTFDSNFYQEIGTQKITLLEEDLLSKEKSPLIIGSDNVRLFASEVTGKKVNDHTYKMNFGKTHLGGRQYLELTHQDEPIFVGLKENRTLSIPSERFMRYILSSFEGGNLGNRCLVQVNLTRPVDKVEVGAESVGSSLMTYTQMLDTDGKFYDSASHKTEKIVIMGENQGGAEVNPDSRINIKLEYQDGSHEYVNTYCSPNTYLVEQL